MCVSGSESEGDLEAELRRVAMKYVTTDVRLVYIDVCVVGGR